MSRFLWRGIILAVITIAASILVGRRAAAWLDVGQPPAKHDYVYILPGHSETRPFVGAWLVQRGFAERVLLPTVALSPDVREGLALSHHEIAVGVMANYGIADEQIETLDIGSTSTADESRALAAFLKARPDVRVAIVTSAYHTRRARWTIQSALGVDADRVHFVSAPNPDFHTDRWWSSSVGFRIVTSEYLKLLYYWLRLGHGIYWLTGAMFILGLAVWRRIHVSRREHRTRSSLSKP